MKKMQSRKVAKKTTAKPVKVKKKKEVKKKRKLRDEEAEKKKNTSISEEEILMNLSDEGDPDMDSDTEETGNYSNFMKDLASLEGAPRFIHHNDEVNLDVPMSQLLGQGKEPVSSSSLTAQARISMDDMMPVLSKKKATQEAKNVKKKLVQFASKEGVKKSDKNLKLPNPLSTPESARIVRQAVYSKAKEDLKVWDAVVHSTRAAEHKSFPLQKADMRLATAKDYSKSFKPRNPLEEQVFSLLHKSKSTVEEGKEFSEMEQNILSQMTQREAEEKRQEMIRMRFLVAKHEAKLKRQNKIKSKKYRKLLRKQRDKEKKKELEELEKTDPELALEKLKEESQKSRILERASLRHRNNSKYLQYLAKRAKYDKESNQTVQDQIKQHRALLSKVDLEEEDGEKDKQSEEENGDSEGDIEEESNKSCEKEDFVKFQKNFKSFWSEENERRKQKALKDAQILKLRRREQLEMAENLEDLFFEASKQAKKKIQQSESDEEEEEEEPVEEDEDESMRMKTDNDGKQKDTNKAAERKQKEKKAILDPEKFVRTVNIKLPTMEDENLEPEDNKEDDDEEEEGNEDQETAIAEAFADDDVGVDFRLEKKALQDERKGKTIDLSLPGWGSWGGESIKVSKKKRRKFTIRVPTAEKRADDNKGHLIVREESSVKKHQVSSVPFPFTSVADFEASMRAPVGETFVPRSVFNKLTRPKVTSKVGAVIEPMDREELVKRRKIPSNQEQFSINDVK